MQTLSVEASLYVSFLLGGQLWDSSGAPVCLLLTESLKLCMGTDGILVMSYELPSRSCRTVRPWQSTGKSWSCSLAFSVPSCKL